MYSNLLFTWTLAASSTRSPRRNMMLLIPLPTNTISTELSWTPSIIFKPPPSHSISTGVDNSHLKQTLLHQTSMQDLSVSPRFSDLSSLLSDAWNAVRLQFCQAANRGSSVVFRNTTFLVPPESTQAISDGLLSGSRSWQVSSTDSVQPSRFIFPHALILFILIPPAKLQRRSAVRVVLWTRKEVLKEAGIFLVARCGVSEAKWRRVWDLDGFLPDG